MLSTDFIVVYFTPPFSLSRLLVHVTPWFLLPFCCCGCCLVVWLVGVYVYQFSSCLLEFIYWGSGQRCAYFSVTLWNQYFDEFPFIDEFPSSLPITLEMLRWDSYCVISAAQSSCKQETCNWMSVLHVIPTWWLVPRKLNLLFIP